MSNSMEGKLPSKLRGLPSIGYLDFIYKITDYKLNQDYASRRRQ